MIEIKETYGIIKKPIIRESYVEAFFYTTKKINDDGWMQQGWRVKFVDKAFKKAKSLNENRIKINSATVNNNCYTKNNCHLITLIVSDFEII